MFIAALFTIARTWKQPKCPLTDEWIKKMWHIYTMEYYSVIKRNEIELFFFLILFIYLFMAVLGLRFCARAFLSSCGKWGPLFVAVRGPLTIAASLVAEHRLQTCKLSRCGSRA